MDLLLLLLALGLGYLADSLTGRDQKVAIVLCGLAVIGSTLSFSSRFKI